MGFAQISKTKGGAQTVAELNVNPTRMELKKLKARLATARRGHKLLKDKRDEMIRRFMDIVKGTGELRKRVEDGIDKINADFSLAAAVTSPEVLQESLALPVSEGELLVNYRSVMNVSIPTYSYERKTQNAGALNYGFAFTSGALDSAVSEMDSLLPDLLLLAEKEKTVQMLADEIEKTRRRVNALEYIMIPQYEASIKKITMKLEENERGNTSRLMKVKDMMLRQQIDKRKSEDEEIFGE